MCFKRLFVSEATWCWKLLGADKLVLLTRRAMRPDGRRAQAKGVARRGQGGGVGDEAKDDVAQAMSRQPRPALCPIQARLFRVRLSLTLIYRTVAPA